MADSQKRSCNIGSTKRLKCHFFQSDIYLGNNRKGEAADDVSSRVVLECDAEKNTYPLPGRKPEKIFGSVALLSHNTLKLSAILRFSFLVRCWWARESMIQGSSGYV